MMQKPKRKSNNNSNDTFKYFNEEWNTESPTDDDEGITIVDDEGYEDGVDILPTKKNRTIVDDAFDY